MKKNKEMRIGGMMIINETVNILYIINYQMHQPNLK